MAKPNYIFTKAWAHKRASKDAPYPPLKQNSPGDGHTSIEVGFPDETMMPEDLNGIPPYGQDFNGILKAITENLVWYSAGGIFEYDPQRDYDPPAVVSYLGKLYRCIAPNMSWDPSIPGKDTGCWLHIMDETDVKPIMSSFSGMVGWFASKTAPSDDWLIADGRAVSRTIYKGLFSVLGTLYGSGDGSTTFNLPNLIDRFAMGATSSIGEFVEPGLPNITGSFGYWDGTVNPTSNYGTAFFRTNLGINKAGAKGRDYFQGDIGFDASRSNVMYGNSGTVQPPSIKLLPCVHV